VKDVIGHVGPEGDQDVRFTDEGCHLAVVVDHINLQLRKGLDDAIAVDVADRLRKRQQDEELHAKQPELGQSNVGFSSLRRF